MRNHAIAVKLAHFGLAVEARWWQARRPGMVTDKYIGGGVDKGHAAKLAFFGLAIEVDVDRHGWSSEVQCGWGGVGIGHMLSNYMYPTLD